MSSLRYLSTYETVVRLGSFTAAADELGISKPVVSKQITQLEEQLGVLLFNRTTRRLNLTQAGETFAYYAQKILHDLTEAEQSVRPMQATVSGPLRIAASQSLTNSILPEILVAFQEKYPGVELSVHVSGRYVDLIDEGIDVALRVGPLEDSSLIVKSTLPFQYIICATSDYWNNHGMPQVPKDLVHHNCLIYDTSPLKNAWKFRNEDGQLYSVKVSGRLRSNEGNLLLAAALQGGGVFLGPSYMVQTYIEQQTLVPALLRFQRPGSEVHVLYPKSKLTPLKVRKFVQFTSAFLRR